MPASRLAIIGSRCTASLRRMRDMTARERDFLLDEVSLVRGLMPLLMKPRNGCRWTAAEKTELRAHMRRLRYISPYLLLSVIPGSFIALPVLAWWLDRRRQRRAGAV